MPNTGFKAYTNLEQYYLDSGEATGVTKPNDILDPDYIGPFIDLEYCPLPSLTPTPTPSVTPSTTVTPSITPSITISPSTSPPPPSPSATPSITPSITPSTSIPSTPSATPSVTPSSGFKPSVINASAFPVSCIAGGCEDTVSYTITLDSPAVVAVNYSLEIVVDQIIYAYQDDLLENSPIDSRNITTTLTVSGTIPIGQTYDTINTNPCTTGGGVTVGCISNISSVCISYVNFSVNNNVGTCI